MSAVARRCWLPGNAFCVCVSRKDHKVGRRAPSSRRVVGGDRGAGGGGSGEGGGGG